MDLTIKLTIVFGVLWGIAVVVEMVWFWARNEDQEQEQPVEELGPETPAAEDEPASQQEVQAV